MDSDDSMVGRILGNFRIHQVLGPSTFTADKVGSYGIPEYSVWFEGISTGSTVDGKRISFLSDTVFEHKGTKTYVTVLGAVRTIYYVEALDRDLFGWALERVRQEDAKRQLALDEQQRRRIDAAKGHLAEIESQLKKLESDNAKVSEYIRLRSKVQMYEPNTALPGIAELLSETKAKLEALGPVSDAEAQAYRKEHAKLTERRRAALVNLNSVGG